jgi:2-keto-4-pentenoate hydratase/2-oxohepta-3-ene-1,7-dioic acid hydratase in catechol pathway
MKVGKRYRNGVDVPFAVTSSGDLLDWDALRMTDMPLSLQALIRSALERADDAAFLAALAPLEEYLADRPDILKGKGNHSMGSPLDQTLAPPVRPRNFLCVGLNYIDHARESKMEIPSRPLLFAKTSNAISGHGEAVRRPCGSSQLDFEAELAVVIGKRCRNASVNNALDYVAGYTCANDISARDFQFADGQWYRGKSCDGFGPVGPWMVTKTEITNPSDLAIRCRLNGTTMQDSTTANLIFSVADLIAFISSSTTLEPGDLIATGTPPGVGFARKPPVYFNAETWWR